MSEANGPEFHLKMLQTDGERGHWYAPEMFEGFLWIPNDFVYPPYLITGRR